MQNILITWYALCECNTNSTIVTVMLNVAWGTKQAGWTLSLFPKLIEIFKTCCCHIQVSLFSLSQTSNQQDLTSAVTSRHFFTALSDELFFLGSFSESSCNYKPWLQHCISFPNTLTALLFYISAILSTTILLICWCQSQSNFRFGSAYSEIYDLSFLNHFKIQTFLHSSIHLFIPNSVLIFL